MQVQQLARDTQQLVRDAQRDTWNKFSPGWKKWDQFTMKFLEAQGDAIIRALELTKYDHVLDIASGTGEPGLSIASIVSEGKVTAVDLAEGMLRTADEKALYLGLPNFQTCVADVCELPYTDATFDAISCRLGFMFFPDMQKAVKEIVRVLKPGGTLATTVWGESNRNRWITTMIGAIKKNIKLPDPAPGAPGMFRCAEPGFMTSLFEKAGFSGAVEKEMDGLMNCTSTDEYWAFMNDVVPPVVAVFKEGPDDLKDKIKDEVYHFVEDQCPGDGKEFSYGARLVTYRKPQ